MGNILRQRRVFVPLQETTPGTPMSLTGGTGMFCFDPVPQANIQMDDREAFGTLGELPAIPGPEAGKLSFSIELAGSGTSGSPVPTWASTLLPCCGYTLTTHTFSPTSNPANYKTATLAVYETGTLKVLAGAMGTFTIDAESGKRAMIKFEFTGIWQPPVDAAMPAIATFPITPPRLAGSAFTVGAFTPRISKINFDAGNTVTLIPDISKASNYNCAIVTKRKIRGSMDPAHELVGTWDAFGQWIGITTQAMSLPIGSVAGNIVTLAAPAFQLNDNQETNREDLVTLDSKFQLNESAGDDAFTIAFS